MKTIKKAKLLLKVLVRALSDNDFSMLLNLSEQHFSVSSSDRSDNTARWLLKLYFKKPLDKEQLELLSDRYYMTAQDLWLKSAKKRNFSGIETDYLVKKIPWNLFRFFPFKLPRFSLSDLFDERDPYKLINYCREYILPEDFELLLIEKYRQSLLKRDEKMQFILLDDGMSNGWEKTLIAYLEGVNVTDRRCATANVQKSILELNNFEITKKLVSRWNIGMNCLTYKSVEYLINCGYDELLRILLRDSYLDSDFEKLIHDKTPNLMMQYYIASLRRKFYLEGQSSENYWKAIMFTPYEQDLIEVHESTLESDIDEFVNRKIKPNISSFGSCMCAYLAYHFPNLAQDLYKSLRDRY